MELSFLYCFNHCWVVCYAPNGLSCWSGAGKSEPFTVEEDDVEMEQCLVGKLISAKPFNKAGVRVAIFQAWNFIKELEMDEVDNDRFIFSFPSAVSRQRELDQSPSNIKGYPLLLKPLLQACKMRLCKKLIYLRFLCGFKSMAFLWGKQRRGWLKWQLGDWARFWRWIFDLRRQFGSLNLFG